MLGDENRKCRMIAAQIITTLLHFVSVVSHFARMQCKFFEEGDGILRDFFLAMHMITKNIHILALSDRFILTKAPDTSAPSLLLSVLAQPLLFSHLFDLLAARAVFST